MVWTLARRFSLVSMVVPLAISGILSSGCGGGSSSSSTTSGNADIRNHIPDGAGNPVAANPGSPSNNGSSDPDDNDPDDNGTGGREPVKPAVAADTGRTEPVTFDDLKLEMPVDSVFSDALLTDRVKSLDGRKISIKGFILAAGIFRNTGITEFPLVQNTQCKFGPGGQAFCVILVTLKEGVTTDFTLKPITVEGVLKVDPYTGIDGNTWSMYTMVGDKVN